MQEAAREGFSAGCLPDGHPLSTPLAVSESLYCLCSLQTNVGYFKAGKKETNLSRFSARPVRGARAANTTLHVVTLIPR